MSILRGAACGAMALAALALPACGDGATAPIGDDDGNGDVDAAPTPDPEPDAAPDPEPDAMPPVDDPAPRIVPLSTTGTDGFFGVAYDAQGRFYSAGFRAPGVLATDDRAMVVARFLATGELDASFGDAGVASVNVAVGGGNGEFARGIVVQSDGKVVIGGPIEHDVTATGTAAADRDLALVRFTSDGGLDTTFGTNGIARLDLNTGVEVQGPNGPTLAGADFMWSLARYGDDGLLVHGAQRAEAEGRTDTDWVLVRLSADGAIDDDFGTEGKHTLDLQQVNASARAAIVLADGSAIAAGYANTPGLGSTQPVIYKVTATGQLDTTFGNGGVFHDIVLGAAAEAYSLALQGDKIVTIGYGRAAATEDLDWVSIRLNANGTRDTTWGTEGVVTVDVAGFNDNGRNIIALSDGRMLLVGAGQVAMGVGDAQAVLLDGTGQPVTSFGTGGRRSYDLGGVGDVFWGATLAPDGAHVAIAGYRGAGSSATAENNDDAAVLVLPTP